MADGDGPTRRALAVRIHKVRCTATVDDLVLCVDERDGVGMFVEAERL